MDTEIKNSARDEMVNYVKALRTELAGLEKSRR